MLNLRFESWLLTMRTNISVPYVYNINIPGLQLFFDLIHQIGK